jgi:hypothetical protein
LISPILHYIFWIQIILITYFIAILFFAYTFLSKAYSAWIWNSNLKLIQTNMNPIIKFFLIICIKLKFVFLLIFVRMNRIIIHHRIIKIRIRMHIFRFIFIVHKLFIFMWFLSWNHIFVSNIYLIFFRIDAIIWTKYSLSTLAFHCSWKLGVTIWFRLLTFWYYLSIYWRSNYSLIEIKFVWLFFLVNINLLKGIL